MDTNIPVVCSGHVPFSRWVRVCMPHGVWPPEPCCKILRSPSGASSCCPCIRPVPGRRSNQGTELRAPVAAGIRWVRTGRPHGSCGNVVSWMRSQTHRGTWRNLSEPPRWFMGLERHGQVGTDWSRIVTKIQVASHIHSFNRGVFVERPQ